MPSCLFLVDIVSKSVVLANREMQTLANAAGRSIEEQLRSFSIGKEGPNLWESLFSTEEIALDSIFRSDGPPKNYI